MATKGQLKQARNIRDAEQHRKNRHLLSMIDGTNRMVFDRDRLRAITESCRPDMHEPDEQDISAIVHGSKLDNAMGDHIDPDKPDYQEIVIEVRKALDWDEDGNVTKSESEFFNLATLLAIAKTAEPMRLLEGHGTLRKSREELAEWYKEHRG